MALNPQRAQTLIAATRWTAVEPGSLNLAVDNSVVNELMRYEPIVEESGASIKYPPPHEGIPIRRKRYFYFLATASAHGKEHAVLVRRAEVPPYPGLVELYASQNLMAYFAIDDGDPLTVELNATLKDGQSGVTKPPMP